jgi:uncharacterized membrane protein required for colicin V production
MKQPLPINLESIPGNWFDGVIIVLLIVGLVRGRKRGMSEELLSIFQWLTIVVVCSLYYEPLAIPFARLVMVTLVYANVFTYTALFLAIVCVFTLIRRAVGEKLVGSDLFGRQEYYLGMLAGLLRYACMILVFMAIVNGPVYTRQELIDQAKQQQQNYGSISLPSFGLLQHEIMNQSYCSQLVSEHLSTLLIKKAYYQPSRPRESLGRRRNNEIKEILDR